MLLKAVQSKGLAGPLLALFWLAAVTPANSGSPEISVVGAVEAVSCQARTIRVLGITFAATDAGTAAAVCKTGNPSDLRFVAANGRVGPGGSVGLSKLVRLSAGQYVPGASPVYIRGTISDSSANTGIVVLSGAVVSMASAEFRRGSVVEILGTQPVLGGVVIPATIRQIDAQVVEPSDSISNSSIGSGANLKSSIGSGASVNSSIGSGANLKSSIGSGASVDSSIGSGANLKSSIGSGASVDSSIGSGANLKSSIGSGASVDSSIGSGANLKSSIGSGVNANSSIGSGID